MKIIRSIKRYYYRLRLKEAENWIESKEAGELSDWDNYCTQAEFDYYKNTFDKTKKEEIKKWVRKIINS